MNLKKRFPLLAILFLMFVGFFVFSPQETSAQTRIIYRPVRIYRPFFNRWYYDPFYSSYYYDPYLEARRNRYYAEQRVARERRDMAEHKEKYYADGVITAKERAQMIDDQRQLANAINDLNRYRSRY